VLQENKRQRNKKEKKKKRKSKKRKRRPEGKYRQGKVNSNYARPSVISQQTQLHWLRDFGCVFKGEGLI